MTNKRVPVAEIGFEDYRIVRHTHDVGRAVGLMRAALIDNDGCPAGECDRGVWGRGVCLHKRDVGRPALVWMRVVHCLPGSYGKSEGWAYQFHPASGPGRGVFAAVEFR